MRVHMTQPHSLQEEWCLKVMVDDESDYFQLLLQCSLATMIMQHTPNTRLQDDVGHTSLHVVHCMTHSMSY